jgi:hypothetical protein
MELQPMVVSGWVGDDGALHVGARVGLPPGPVNITVEPVNTAAREDTRQALKAIWKERKARGAAARSKEEIDAEVDSMRNEDEQRMRKIERLHEQIRLSGE